MFRKPNFAFRDSHSRFWLISITKRVLCSYTKVYEGKKIKKESWQYLVHFRNGANLERGKKKIRCLATMEWEGQFLRDNSILWVFLFQYYFEKQTDLLNYKLFSIIIEGVLDKFPHSSSSKIFVFSSTPSLPSTKDLWWQNTDSFSRISLH